MVNVRVATHGPTLAWARLPDVAETPPPVTESEGRPVRWDDWEIAPQISHVEYGCAACGYDGQPWLTTGIVPPAPGQTILVPREKHLPSGRVYLTDQVVAAWPLRRLFAYHCPACEADEVYDTGTGGKQWTALAEATGQAALF